MWEIVRYQIIKGIIDFSMAGALQGRNVFFFNFTRLMLMIYSLKVHYHKAFFIPPTIIVSMYKNHKIEYSLPKKTFYHLSIVHNLAIRVPKTEFNIT